MEIWILDDDIACSFETKEKIKDILQNRAAKTRFEVFHSIQDLLDAWGKAVKNKRPKPQLSVLELVIEQQKTQAELPREFWDQGFVIICSSQGYGGYQKDCQIYDVPEQPFIQKSQFDLQIKSILEDFLKTQKAYDPTIKKKLKICLNAIQELEKIYYDKLEGSVFDLACVIERESTKHNQPALAKVASEFISLKDQKGLKGAALNKALKEFIGACGKFKETHQIES